MPVTGVWQILGDSVWPIVRASLAMTIPISLAAFAIGLAIGVIVAIARLSKWRALRLLVWFYVWVFRGSPLLVQLYIVFFGLPTVGINLHPVTAAIATLALNIGAFCSETIRACITAVPAGQWEAAKAVGLTGAQTMQLIVLPQAVTAAIPPLGNSFISLVKDTSLVSSITVVELFRVSQQIAARTYEILPLYLLAAAVYLFYSTLLTWLQQKLETHFGGASKASSAQLAGRTAKPLKRQDRTAAILAA
ncbi:MAG: amino acid ABC transporter permease [Propionibacteriaceae bacterium]|jgi:cystine transport system permease protein|nr:amino acid ABC transporter permease [Propionibacteriaceae bacterium]